MTYTVSCTTATGDEHTHHYETMNGVLAALPVLARYFTVGKVLCNGKVLGAEEQTLVTAALTTVTQPPMDFGVTP